MTLYLPKASPREALFPLVLVAMTGSLSMIMLDQTVVTVALPAMSDDLGLGPRASSGWSTPTCSR